MSERAGRPANPSNGTSGGGESSSTGHASVSARPGSAPNSRSFSGRTIACLVGWPGVAGTCSASVSITRPPGWSTSPAPPPGVPARLYQRPHCVRSPPPPSPLQPTHSPQPPPVPSNRPQYSTLPPPPAPRPPTPPLPPPNPPPSLTPP